MTKFLAKIFRMKNINRWQLMRTTQEENLSQHSAEVAMIAHSLAIIANEKFACNYDIGSVVIAALYHDVSEVITGDMPTPIKYANKDISEQYKKLESSALTDLLSVVPDFMSRHYRIAFYANSPLVKAADKISAYLKCVEEVKYGNHEFSKAMLSLEQAIIDIDLPEVDYFMKEFVPAFQLTLDDL